MWISTNLHRKYNVPSRLIFLTWVTLTVAVSATYASKGPAVRVVFPLIPLDRSRPKARSNCHYGFLSSSYTRECVCLPDLAIKEKSVIHSRRDYVDFTIPPPFNSRVRNALNAEAKSVRLSALVGAGGHWYGFGKIIMRL